MKPENTLSHLNILIKSLIKNKTLNIKNLPLELLEEMNFGPNGPTHILSTVSVYFYMSYCEKKGSKENNVSIPFRQMLKITRDVGFLCQLERLRRKNVIDYSLDMEKFFEPGTKIDITKGSNFLMPENANLLS